MNYHLDFEGYSAIDLTEVGAFRYAADPSTEIFMFGIASDTEGPYLWVNPKYRSILPSDPRADRLVRAFGPKDVLWAHSALFEVAMRMYRWAKDVALPLKIGLHQWRCTALLGRMAGMPSKLERLAEVLNLTEQKDPKGKELIRLLCIPQKDGDRVRPNEAPEKFRELGAYCLQDVRTEKAIHHKLSYFELTDWMLEAWQFDLRMNVRGFPVNVSALKHAQGIIVEASKEVEAKFHKLTGLMPTQRAKMKAYLEARGLPMKDMKADTVEETLLGLDPKHKAYDPLQLYALVQFAAVKKVKAMLDSVCPDGRIRGMLLFYGAGTGRWSGRGVQPQNFKRPTIKRADLVYQMLCQGRSWAEIDLVHGNVLDAISSCIRNFIHWLLGDMLDADYNAVEARIICWLAGQQDRLNDWRNGIDQYKMMAARIYARTMESIINPSDEREVGKRTILGCGFGMAGKKFKSTLKDQYGIIVSQELANKCVSMYRQMHKKVQDFWWDCQKAAIRACQQPGTTFRAGPHIRFIKEHIKGIPFLFLILPSGRRVAYPWPELTPNPEREGELELSYAGEHKGQWVRVRTYGGKLAENATQAVAADVMMNGSVNAEALGAEIIMLVHDQAPALNRNITLDEYVAALTDLPSWADGLPIKAEGRIIPYYKK